MFEDSLIESTNRIKTRRGWATLLSFALQAAAVCVLVLIPLLVTQAIPTPQLMTTLTAPPPPPPPPPPPAASQPQPKVQPTSQVTPDELREPIKIPNKIAMVKETPQMAQAAAPPVGGVVGGVPGGVAGGQVGGVLGGVLNATPTAVPKVATPKKIRVSQGVSEGLLVHKVMPTYPSLARQARIQGDVILRAVISKDGKIQNLEVVSGHPMLTLLPSMP